MKTKYANLVHRMQAQLLKLGYSKFTGKLSKSSGKRIPAVSKVNVKTREFNEILLEAGIRKKLPPKITFKSTSEQRMNKYIEYQISRMRKALSVGHYDKFGTIANSCMRVSVSFRVSAINAVIPSGGYSYSFNRILFINRKVTHILRSEELLEYRRKYILKASGKGRPLGIPADEGRIALHMMQNMIQLAVERHVLDCQHAFIPGRGTLSAGREVIEKAIASKYIYETDIKGFFDNVSIDWISEVLSGYNFPEEVVDGIQDQNLRAPRLPNELKLLSDEEIEINRKAKAERQFSSTAEERNILISHMIMTGDTSRQEGLGDGRGVPQGAPTSPILAILALQPYLEQENCVNYADDQIFYSEKPFEINEYPEMGIYHAPEKCAGIKKDGKGLKELKFLGMVYNPGKKELRSETRSGTSIGMHGDLKKVGQDLRYNEYDNYLEDLAKRNFFGFIQACMYNGSFDVKHYPVKEKQEIKSSGLGKYRNSKTMSSIAIKYLAENIKNGTTTKRPFKLISKKNS